MLNFCCPGGTELLEELLLVQEVITASIPITHSTADEGHFMLFIQRKFLFNKMVVSEAEGNFRLGFNTNYAKC
jgi:hypothetical protein